MEPNLKRAVALVTRMMAIPGVSGQEGKIIDFIIKHLRGAGLPASRISRDQVQRHSPFGGDEGNLIVKLPGTVRAPRRMLMAHVDTVPVCEGSKPMRRGNIITSADPRTGLGADNRSGAAAVLTVAWEILRNKLPHPPLTFFFPVQEEVGLIGARHVSLSKLGQPRMAFNYDGGAANEIVTGATGAYRMTIEIEGIASHAGVHPEDGVSAIAIAGLAIAGLTKDGWHGDIRKGRKRGTSNIGMINAGSATNVVAPTAFLRAEARSHDRKFRKRILKAIKDAFDQAVRSVRNAKGARGRVRIHSELDYEAFQLSLRSPCIMAVEKAIRSIGQRPVQEVINGGLDANWTTSRGIPTVTLGAGQHHPHTVDELLNVKEFEAGCRLGLRLATSTERQ